MQKVLLKTVCTKLPLITKKKKKKFSIGNWKKIKTTFERSWNLLLCLDCCLWAGLWPFPSESRTKREINSNFIFTLLCGASKGFMITQLSEMYGPGRAKHNFVVWKNIFLRIQWFWSPKWVSACPYKQRFVLSPF